MGIKKRWFPKPEPDIKLVKTLSKELGISKKLTYLLAQRGVKTFDEARYFFRPDIHHLEDPFLMQDMFAAIDRIDAAIENKEGILVFGDYDVDGTTAVATVYGFFSKRHNNIDYYIPDRYKEGYGISNAGIDYAADNGYSLIIALDCGIKSIDKVEYAKQKGIDFIICDHHQPGDTLPDAVAVLDPKRKDCDYPYKELSGCGVGFKLIQGYLIKHDEDPKELEDYLDFGVVSIASDIVDITGENRAIAYYGLEKLKNNPSPGLKCLLGMSLKDTSSLTISNLVFIVGPRINAAGRMSDAKASVRLLLSKDEEEAKEHTAILNEFNSDRKEHDQSITEEALELIASNKLEINRKTTVLYSDDWHKGVIGIVASRLTETYYRPTIVLTKSNGKYTGSGRSIPGFDLYNAIDACSDLLEQFGGHTFAAGLTLLPENVETFKAKFEEVVSASITEEILTPMVEYDMPLRLDDITPKFAHIVYQLAPFGPGNMNPVFMTEGVEAKGEPRVVGETHLKLSLISDTSLKPIDAIAFGFGHMADDLTGKKFNICYTIEENTFRGITTLQLNIKDIKLPDLLAGTE